MKSIALAGIGAAAGAFSHGIPAAGWVTIGVVVLVTLWLFWRVLQDDKRTARLVRLIHGPNRRQ